jgi:hypothetical protein
MLRWKEALAESLAPPRSRSPALLNGFLRRNGSEGGKHILSIFISYSGEGPNQS